MIVVARVAGLRISEAADLLEISCTALPRVFTQNGVGEIKHPVTCSSAEITSLYICGKLKSISECTTLLNLEADGLQHRRTALGSSAAGPEHLRLQ